MKKIKNKKSYEVYQDFRKKLDSLEKNKEKNSLKIIKLCFEHAYYYYSIDDIDECSYYISDIYSECFMKAVRIRDYAKYQYGEKNRVKQYLKDIKKAIKYFKSKKGTKGLNYYLIASQFGMILDESEYTYYLDKAIKLGNKEALVLKAEFENEKGNHNLKFELANRYYNEGKYYLSMTDAINILAYSYLNGLGVDENYEKGISLLEENFFKYRNDEILNYYYTLGEIGDYPKIREYIDKAKKNKIDVVKFKEKYPYSDSDVSNNIKAKKYYELALNKDCKAQYELYKCFKYGRGVRQSDTDAFRWLKASYDNGNIEVADELAKCYQEGIGVEKNQRIANELLSQKYDKVELYEKYEKANNDEEKIKWLTLSANAGYDVAQNKLAYLYSYGKMVKKDVYKAFSYYTDSAEQGNINAKNNLALCYIDGIGTSIDPDKAFKIVNEIIDTNNSVTQRLLGVCYYYGYGCEIDYNKAYYYLNLASKQGDIIATVNLGICYYNGTGCEIDYNKAFNCFKIGVDNKIVSAHYFLGKCYYNGNGCNKDLNKCLELMKYAADNVNRYACSFLGDYYYEKKDYVNAKPYLEKASVGDIESSMFNLGIMYYYGHGCEIDKKKSFLLMERVASKGNENAIYNIGLLYCLGDGCERNYNKAFEYLSRVKNKKKTAYFLGVFYYHGYGCEKELVKAKECLEMAYRNGDNRALGILGEVFYELKEYKKAREYLELIKDNYNTYQLNLLGDIYHQGLDVAVNHNKGISYYEKSASLGSDYAIVKLGNIYYFGEGVKKDNNKAFYYYKLGADKGDQISRYYLAYCYYRGDGCEEDLDNALYYLNSIDKWDSSIRNNEGMLEDIDRIKKIIEQEKRELESSNSYDDDGDDDDDYDDDYDYDEDDDDDEDDTYIKVYPVDSCGDPITSETPVIINTITGFGDDGNLYNKDISDDTWYTDNGYSDDED
ncbi:MAG: sel1 repeat family protein [Acholeplasmatales bacterium]|nr:sel1 repeat family protein [Acholeplasmatales bacterium]